MSHDAIELEFYFFANMCVVLLDQTGENKTMKILKSAAETRKLSNMNLISLKDI